MRRCQVDTSGDLQCGVMLAVTTGQGQLCHLLQDRTVAVTPPPLVLVLEPPRDLKDRLHAVMPRRPGRPEGLHAVARPRQQPARRRTPSPVRS